MKLKTIWFGIAAGITWGFFLMTLTIISAYTGYAEQFLTIFKSVYIGYDLTITGAFIGLIYGFIDAFFGAYIFALIYNFLTKK